VRDTHWEKHTGRDIEWETPWERHSVRNIESRRHSEGYTLGETSSGRDIEWETPWERHSVRNIESRRHSERPAQFMCPPDDGLRAPSMIARETVLVTLCPDA
jgi:hypothetical protein